MEEDSVQYRQEPLVNLHRQHALWYQLKTPSFVAYFNITVCVPPQVLMADIHRWCYLSFWEPVIQLVEQWSVQDVVVSPIDKPFIDNMLIIRVVNCNDSAASYLYLPFSTLKHGPIIDTMVSEDYTLSIGDVKAHVLLDHYAVGHSPEVPFEQYIEEHIKEQSVVILPASYSASWQALLCFGCDTALLSTADALSIPCSVKDHNGRMALSLDPQASIKNRPNIPANHLRIMLHNPVNVPARCLFSLDKSINNPMTVDTDEITLTLHKRRVAKGLLVNVAAGKGVLITDSERM